VIIAVGLNLLYLYVLAHRLPAGQPSPYSASSQCFTLMLCSCPACPQHGECGQEEDTTTGILFDSMCQPLTLLDLTSMCSRPACPQHGERGQEEDTTTGSLLSPQISSLTKPWEKEDMDAGLNLGTPTGVGVGAAAGAGAGWCAVVVNEGAIRLCNTSGHVTRKRR